MYVYLYDNIVRQKQYEPVLKAIETRLTDYGIAGKIIRLQNFANAEMVVQDEMRRGAKTIVVVGNDITLGHVLSRAASCQVVFGFLPIGEEQNSIAEVVGIPLGAESCDVLARRRKMRLDAGWFNNRYFISQLHISPHRITVRYDEKFVVKSATGKMELVVCNLQPFSWMEKRREITVHPQDGKLEAFVRPIVTTGLLRRERYEEPSIFPFEEMLVTSTTPFTVTADGKVSKETKVTIRLARNRIEMIVGKERRF